MLQIGIPWYPWVTSIFSLYTKALGESVYQENTIKWHVGYCIVYHVIENTVANPIDAAHGGKLGVNTIEHIVAFLCSDKAVYYPTALGFAEYK